MYVCMYGDGWNIFHEYNTASKYLPMINTSHEVGHRNIQLAGHLTLTLQRLGTAGQVRFPAEGLHLPAAVVGYHRLDNVPARVDDDAWRAVSPPDIFPGDAFTTTKGNMKSSYTYMNAYVHAYVHTYS